MGIDVKGKIVLVTGSNRGIGKQIVKTLLEHGASKVYAAVRDTVAAKDLVSESQGKVVAIPIDLSNPETIVAAASQAKDVQIVINNAGVLRAAELLSADALEALQFELEVNTFGLVRVAQAFAPILAGNGGGAFVQINSVVSVKTFSDVTTYCASKAASYSVTQGLREVLGKQGTQVVSVHPGPIATDMANDAGFGEIAEPASLVSEAIVKALANDEFHVFPDSMAKGIWQAYESFARNVVESNMSEG